MQVLDLGAGQAVAVKPALLAIFILIMTGCAPVPAAEPSRAQAGSGQTLDLPPATAREGP